MIHHPLADVLRHVRGLIGAVPAGEPSDGELLDCFISRRDGSAFAALVERHGPTVLGVCQRLLAASHDAEDVFQATFLVLVHQAHTISKRDSLSSWLYGVAYRLALKARAQAARRRQQVEEMRTMQPCAEPHWDDLRPMLDDELNRLPEKYRAPLILCYLEGRPYEEAARRLGCPAGTVSGRLARARELLRRRLARRGVALGGGTFASLLGHHASAAVPIPLRDITVRNALVFAATDIAAGAISEPVLALVEGWARAMMTSKLKMAAIVLLVAGALSAVTGLGLSNHEAAEQPIAPVPTEARPPARLDLHGDPLPPGAVVRLGTVRMQHDGEVTSGYFAADGKSLTTAGQDHTIRRWDLATGKELQRVALQLPKEERYTHRRHLLSPDGTKLATIYMATTGESIPAVCLWDTARGTHRVLEGRLKAQNAFLNLAFSPDGATVAATSSDGDVRFWDTASGALVRQISVGKYANTLALAPGGTWVAVGTHEGVVVRDGVGNKEARKLPSGGVSLAFSADGKQLVAAGKPVRVWDVESGKTLLELDLDEKVGVGIISPRDAVLSPDGKALAVDMRGTVILIDTATRQKVRTMVGDRKLWVSKRMFFSADGRYLAVPGQLNFHTYETATGQALHDDGHRGAVKSVAFAPDGKTLATADHGAVRLWDAATGKEQRRWPSRDCASLAFAPDGKALAHADGTAIRLRDPATGNELPQFPSLQASTVAFSPDGTALATQAASDPALWDAATGKNVRQFKSEKSQTLGLAYSPDGKTLASGGDALYLWDTATGTRRHRIQPPSTQERTTFVTYSAVAFSPDGAHVAAFGGRHLVGNDTRSLSLYNVNTGRAVGRFHITDCQKCHMVVAFSPDGKALAMGDTSNDVMLWEVFTGKQRAKLTGHRRFMESLAFAPDGKRLASASGDGTALVWDLREAARPATRAPDACWHLLSDDNVAAAYDAIQDLVRRPEQALPVLRQRLKPVAAIELRRIEALVADLDSNQFNTRKKATDELEQLGDLAEAALRKAIAGRPPLEVRQRLDELLDRLATIQVASPGLLQALRGVEVLEHIGTEDAKELLRVLAAGAAGARLTREARAALDRLIRRDGG